MNIYPDILIYTAICGNYPYQRDDISCAKGDGIFTNPIMEAKRYKVLGHLFSKADILIWVDGNIKCLKDTSYLAEKYLGNMYDLAIFKHPERNCIYDEFRVLRSQQRFQIPFLQKQLEQQEYHYKESGYPRQNGLWECNFIIRRNLPQVNALFNEWWAEICRWQWRDQVSFPVVLQRHRHMIRFNTITEPNIRRHPDFEYKNHY